MKGNKKKIESLFQSYINNTCSTEDIRTLLKYFNAGENEELLRDLIGKQTEGANLPIAHEELLNTTFKKIKQVIAVDDKEVPIPAIPLYNRFWFRACAAVILVFLISVPALYFFRHTGKDMALQNTKTRQLAKDVAPGTNNAVLTLDNGTAIMLDSAANGTLAQQGNTNVQKMNGQITYHETGDAVNAGPVYNTITTARGNQYQLVLSDGSKVWLNAASSIRFPASFIGNERKVEITGEAYFEVTKDASKPFKVEFSTQSGGKAEVQVIGTHFNINAYLDNENIKTTLLEGSVKIKTADHIQMLAPGQQALLSADAVTLNKDADVLQVVAWKDGFFMFNNTDLKAIMKQAARWYNLDVDYESKIATEGFTGKISRNVPLSEFLKVLEMNDVHVKTEGRKVTISP